MKKETLCVQAGYSPESGEARVVPIVQSTTFKYESTQMVGDLFDLKAGGYFYTRLANPTAAAAEGKINALDGGVGALMTSSGQAATHVAVTNIVGVGDHIVISKELYGGSANLLGVTLKKYGIDSTIVNINDMSQIKAAIRENTKLVFCETIANPATTVSDIEAIAKVAHDNKIPLIVDNTFATPCICRPIEFGADIVVYSASKYLDGHAVALSGMIVDSGNFDWEKSGKFACITDPDDSYHGMVYTKAFGKAAYIMKARLQLMRDLGFAPAPMNAFLLNLGMETLHLRMPRHSENALKVAEFLQSHKLVKTVKYAALKTSPSYERAQKYLGGQGSGVLSFELGSYEQCVKFIDGLKLVALVVHVADLRSSVLHPASSTHRQLTSAQLVDAGISDGFIRFSVGLENIDDIIADVNQSLSKL